LSENRLILFSNKGGFLWQITINARMTLVLVQLAAMINIAARSVRRQTNREQPELPVIAVIPDAVKITW